MKNDRIYQVLKEKMNTISSLPPQEVGPFTIFWKLTVPYFKNFPLKIFILTGLLSSIFIWLILGPAISRLTTILQFGF